MLSLILKILWKVKVKKSFLKRLSSVCQKMFILMPTFWEEFWSLIESCILRVKEEMLLFTNAEPTYLSDRIVWWGPLHNLPFDVVGDVVPYKRPDILTEGGACVVLIHSVDVRHVAVDSCSVAICVKVKVIFMIQFSKMWLQRILSVLKTITVQSSTASPWGLRGG